MEAQLIPDLWGPCGLGAIRPTTSQPLICSCPPTPHNKDGVTVSPYHRGGISLGTRLTWPQSPGLTGQAPGERCVCAPAHCFNRRTRLETRVLRGGSCPAAAWKGLGGQEGCLQDNDSPVQRHQVGESIAWPGQVPGLQDVLGGPWGRQEVQPQGRTFLPSTLAWGTGPATSPSRPRWWWHPPPISTASTEQTGPHPRSPGTQGPGEFLQLEPGGEKELKVPVPEAPDLRAEGRAIEI